MVQILLNQALTQRPRRDADVNHGGFSQNQQFTKNGVGN
jgi:hypothetical protein